MGFFMQLETGKILEGKVTGITKFGAFVDLGEGVTGMVHISEVAPTFVKEIRDYLTENQAVKVKVLNVGPDGKISLSIKRVDMDESRPPHPGGARPPHPGGSRPPFQGGNRPPHPGGSRPPFQGGNRPPRRDGGWEPRRPAEPQNFEDMMAKFKQNSEEKMSDLKRFMDNKRGPGSRRSKP